MPCRVAVTLHRTRPQRTAPPPSPISTRVTCWYGVTRPRTSGPTATQPARQTIRSNPPKNNDASRTPSGRQVCGNGGSETAGMDVGDQDGACPDLPELVHDPLRGRPGHHRPDGEPALTVQR